jgi:MerR family transcriptional regulator, redox-sensitive transcriptional activator SoxR
VTIGEIARQTGLRASAIRYYERVGILPAARRVGGQRRYSSDTVDRLAVIQFTRFTGFTVAEIRELFHKFPDGTPPPARWQKLARRKMEEVDALIEHAQGIKKMLAAGLRCECLDLEECGRVIRARSR